MLVPKLRFKEFEDSWTIDELGNFVDINSGDSPSKFKMLEKGIPYFKVEQLNNCYKYQDNTIYHIIIDKPIKKGSIIFPKRGAAILLNKIRILKYDSYIDTNLMSLTTHNINNEFLYYYLLKSNLSNIADTSSIPQINNKHILPYKIRIPALKEQCKISKTLSLLDQKIELQQRKIEVLKMYKRGLINKIFNIQYNNTLRLKDLIKEKSIRNKENIVKEVYSVNNKCGFILQAEQFKDREVASEDTSNYKIVQYNDFAYNPARINVGSIARMKKYNKGIISPMYICFSCNEKLLPEYLEYYYDSEVFRHEMTKRLEGSVRMCLSYEAMINIPLDLPKAEEQKRTTKILVEIDNKIEKEEKIFSAIKRLKKGLLQKMFI